MILWISLASIFVILLFIITRWIGIKLEGDEHELTVSASFSRLRFTVYPGSAGDKEDKEKKKVGLEEDKKEEGKPKKEKLKNAMEWLRLLGDFSDLVKNGLDFLRRHGRIAQLNFRGRLGSSDPYLTGIISGLIETLRGILGQAVPSSKIEVTPVFGEERLDLAGTFEVEIRLIYIVFLIIFSLWNLPKRKVWRLVRS